MVDGVSASSSRPGLCKQDPLQLPYFGEVVNSRISSVLTSPDRSAYAMVAAMTALIVCILFSASSNTLEWPGPEHIVGDLPDVETFFLLGLGQGRLKVVEGRQAVHER